MKQEAMIFFLKPHQFKTPSTGGFQYHKKPKNEAIIFLRASKTKPQSYQCAENAVLETLEICLNFLFPKIPPCSFGDHEEAIQHGFRHQAEWIADD